MSNMVLRDASASKKASSPERSELSFKHVLLLELKLLSVEKERQEQQKYFIGQGA